VAEVPILTAALLADPGVRLEGRRDRWRDETLG
jgi:hypothetical protein